MPILASRGRLNLLLDQSQDAIDVSYKCLAVDDSSHSANCQESLTSVFVAWLANVVDYASNGVLQELLITCKDMLDVLVHDWDQLYALFLDQGVPCGLS